MRHLLQLLKANARRGSYRAEGNTIWIHDVIVSAEAETEWWGGVAAETVARQLAGMTGPVTLRLNSPGGDVFGGRAMASAIEAYPDRVTAIIDGYAASAASIVAVAADEIVMAPGTFLMIHNSWTFTMGDKGDHLDQAAVLEKIDRSLAETYAARGKHDAEAFARLMEAETWFTADEAIAAGLADRIADKADKAKAQWDLSAYRAPPPAPPANDNTSEDQRARRQRMAAVRTRIGI